MTGSQVGIKQGLTSRLHPLVILSSPPTLIQIGTHWHVLVRYCVRAYEHVCVRLNVAVCLVVPLRAIWPPPPVVYEQVMPCVPVSWLSGSPAG